MLRHRHRFSRDIDIFLPEPQYLGFLTPRLNSAGDPGMVDYLEQHGSIKIYYPEGEVDFVAAPSLTANPVVPIFACRHCHQLAYASQREVGYVRAVRKMERLRDKLDWGPGIISGDRSRPKGMHRRTYVRLAAEHDGLVGQYLAGMTQRVEDMGRFLE